MVQKGISFLPQGHKINYLFQKYVTKGVLLSDEYFFDRLTHAQKHIGKYQEYYESLEGKRTLELGTGWYPVVPLSCFLSGAAQIYSVDITPLTNKEKLLTTLRYFVQEKAQLGAYLAQISEERFKVLESCIAEAENLSYEDLLKKLHLKFEVKDARALDFLEDESIDLLHSNNTFEHVYAEVLPDILQEFARLTKSNGLQSHFIDMSDHFAHADSSITIYNFLQFSPKRWKRIDNSIQPQNRLRFKDYLKIYEDLNLPVSETDYRPGSLEDLARVDLDESYKDYSPEELAISHGYVFSK